MCDCVYPAECSNPWQGTIYTAVLCKEGSSHVLEIGVPYSPPVIHVFIVVAKPLVGQLIIIHYNWIATPTIIN